MNIFIVTKKMPGWACWGHPWVKSQINYNCWLIMVSMDFFTFERSGRNCYIFETQEKISPWFLNLGRYLPGENDWTTTTEVLEQTGSDPNGGIDMVQRLVEEGKVVPFKPFAVTWIFMRRPWEVLFSEEVCKEIGCDHKLRGRTIRVLRNYLDIPYHISVADFLLRISTRSLQYCVSGAGPKIQEVVRTVLDRHQLKLDEAE